MRSTPCYLLLLLLRTVLCNSELACTLWALHSLHVCCLDSCWQKQLS